MGPVKPVKRKTTGKRAQLKRRKTRTKREVEEQPAEHLPLAGTNRTHTPPSDDTPNEQRLRRARELKGQVKDDRHPGRGHRSHRVDQREAEKWETHADHTGGQQRAANQKQTREH